MKLTGTIVINAPIDRCWALVRNPVALAACVPGIRDVHPVDERTFEGSITASVGPLDGDFTFTAVITRMEPPSSIDVEVTGLDSVTKSRLETTVTATMAEDPPGTTTLVYRAEVRVKGRLAILGEMVLRATATMMVNQVAGCLRSRLEAASS